MSSPTSIRVARAAATSGGAWAVFADTNLVCYASGFAPEVEPGDAPFAGGPSVAFVSPDGQVTLLVTNLERSAGEESDADEVVDYVGFSGTDPVDVYGEYVLAVRAQIVRLGIRGTVAVDPRTLPASVADALTAAGCDLVSIDPALTRARSIKTDDEIAKLTRSARVADAGQMAVAETIRGLSDNAELTELELFARMRCAMETAAGGRVAVAGDLVAGIDRTAAIGGWPRTRLIGIGDPIIADLAPRVNGYWADSANTVVRGEPSDALVGMHGVVLRAFERAREVARPGMLASELHTAVHSVVTAGGYHYPHHTEHGIGVSVHEFPRLVPGEHAELREGMVLLIEPGAYEPGVGGLRLEWMFHLTSHGLEPLNRFPHALG